MSDNSQGECWVGFDLGGSKMLAAVYDAEFQMLGRDRKRTRAHEGLETGLQRIVRTIRKALDEAEISDGQLGGIGFGTAGPLDLQRGVLLEAPNLNWNNIKLKQLLEDEFHCPAVVVNDVDAGVYGEFRFGAGRDARCVLGVFPGTGIGGGCVYEGQILRGSTNSCLEIGHIQVLPGGPLCGCGQSGCLEALASRLVIAGAAAQAAHRGQAPKLRELAGTDVSKIRSGVLAESIAAGDSAVAEILRDAARHIGVAVATAVHLLAPDIVVLGGGLVEAMPEIFVDVVSKSANRRVLPSFVKSFAVKAAELSDDATVMGAAAWAAAEISRRQPAPAKL